MNSRPELLALDFDGVLCDGMQEYFHTAWRVYRKVWEEKGEAPPAGLAERFARLRPVIESGWEMALLLRAILLGYTEEELFADWIAAAEKILQQDGLTPGDLGPLLNTDRDAQIRENLDAWLSRNRFYPGVIGRLRSCLDAGTQLRIVTTKEERYTRRLLEREGIDLAGDWIVGRSAKRAKHETLRRYRHELGSSAGIWFVEDRLATLQEVRRQADLEGVRLFLADWGYNTPEEREAACSQSGIRLVSLGTFLGDFSGWLP